MASKKKTTNLTTIIFSILGNSGKLYFIVVLYDATVKNLTFSYMNLKATS